MKNTIQLIKEILDIDQNLHGFDYLKMLIKNTASTLDLKYAFIGHPTSDELTAIQTDVVWANGDFQDNFIYNLENTPCSLVLSGDRVCIHDAHVCKDFPNDLLLQEMGVEAYVGAPVILRGTSGVSSILVLLDDKPMKEKDFFIAIADFLSIRASAELEKYRIEEKLTQEVVQRTLELKEANLEIELINKTLEERVKEEVSKNEQKQRIITEQSKMAIMSELIDNVSHQWKEPLNTIIAYSTSIKLKQEMEDLDPEFLNTSMDSITTNAEYLSQTITDFRDFFKSNKNQELYYLKDAIDKTLKMMSSRLKNSSIEVICNTNNIQIEGFSNELMQVLLNILTNACDELITKDNQKKFIFVNLKSDEKYIIIQIKDNAGGIPNALLKKIFNPYVTTKQEHGGSGVGLYMCKDIIEKHMNGQLDVENCEYEYENETYKGAQFTVKLLK